MPNGNGLIRFLLVHEAEQIVTEGMPIFYFLWLRFIPQRALTDSINLIAIEQIKEGSVAIGWIAVGVREEEGRALIVFFMGNG